MILVINSAASPATPTAIKRECHPSTKLTTNKRSFCGLRIAHCPAIFICNTRAKTHACWLAMASVGAHKAISAFVSKRGAARAITHAHWLIQLAIAFAGAHKAVITFACKWGNARGMKDMRLLATPLSVQALLEWPLPAHALLFWMSPVILVSNLTLHGRAHVSGQLHPNWSFGHLLLASMVSPELAQTLADLPQLPLTHTKPLWFLLAHSLIFDPKQTRTVSPWLPSACIELSWFLPAHAVPSPLTPASALSPGHSFLLASVCWPTQVLKATPLCRVFTSSPKSPEHTVTMLFWDPCATGPALPCHSTDIDPPIPPQCLKTSARGITLKHFLNETMRPLLVRTHVEHSKAKSDFEIRFWSSAA